ncbi:condensin-2 complex subunit H2 [Anomalospiza imberbis]|uniref:condensin-2 complex subunit H2 n=1 Tax=Anomalospiza imberbis TaxID=187417 RepID=UPI00358FA888
MEEVDSRFLHLLQPIRDLTKNWEVDVAAQLGEYLEELDQICISFDNGKTTMNFTEAALLIQGSACIYSRKVEYLYMLVCQTLDCISNKKREKLPSSLGPDGRDADATFTDKQEEFLSLDDIPETSQASVDMRRDQQPAAVNIVPLTPMSLVPPEDGEKKENPLLSRRGEVLASRRDFRMNTSTPHASGAFLLELDGLSPTHPQQEQRLGTATGTRGLWAGCAAVAVTARTHLSLSPAAAPGSGPAERPSAGSGTARVQALSFCEEAGAAEPDDDDVPGALGDDMEVTPVPNEHIEAQRSTPRTRGYILRGRPPSQEPKALSKEEPNPWQSLDPFGDSEEKPFRKGRPFLVPHGLDDTAGGKRKRRGPRKLQDFTRWFSAAYNNVTEGRKSRRKGPTFADLELLYWQQFKERMAAQRKLQSRGEPLRELEPELEQECRVDSEEGADDDFVEHEDVEPEAPEELEEGALDPPEPSYEELVRRNVELFMASSQKFVQETELSQRIRQWEERIEPLLQEQETRVPFDVQAYGLQLTSRCAEPGRWHSLASLVAGQPPFEVCRYLLASLQLANNAEVELAQDAGLEEALDTVRLRLLSARPAHERFQDFQLPSQRDPDPQ